MKDFVRFVLFGLLCQLMLGCAWHSNATLAQIGDRKEFAISRTVIGLGVGHSGLGRADDDYTITVFGDRSEWRDAEIGVWNINEKRAMTCTGKLTLDKERKRVILKLRMPDGRDFWLNGTFSYD